MSSALAGSLAPTPCSATPQRLPAARRLLPGAGRARLVHRHSLVSAAGREPPPVLSSFLSPGERLCSGAVELLVGQPLGDSTYTATVTEWGPQSEPSVAVGETVVLKAYGLRRGGWKSLEAWELARDCLKPLNHPSLPALLAAFELETPEDVLYCLIRRLAPGRPLTSLVLEERWRPDEVAVTRVLDALLSALAHSHGLRPPVTHGGVSPARVLLDLSSKAVSLAGFGDARSAQAAGLGYAAPEAQSGAASPASDLYAVGCTVLFLLSGKHPCELPLRDGSGTPDWRGVTVTSPALRAVLDTLLRPERERRGDALAALAMLRGGGVARTAPAALVRSGAPLEAWSAPLAACPSERGYRPRTAHGISLSRSFDGKRRHHNASRETRQALEEEKAARMGDVISSRITFKRDHWYSLEFVIPPLALSSEQAIKRTLTAGTFAAAWLALIGQASFASAATKAPLLRTVFTAPFWIAGGRMVTELGSKLGDTTKIRIDAGKWYITRTTLGFKPRRLSGLTSRLAGARAARAAPEAPLDADTGPAIVLLSRREEGEEGYDVIPVVEAGLRPVEVRWICGEINQYLADLGEPKDYLPIEWDVGGEPAY